jgi:hypothetical protein
VLGIRLALPADHEPLGERLGPVDLPLRDHRLADAARRRRSVLFATGHPGDLDPLYGAIAELAAARGARIVRPADGAFWRDEELGQGWTIAYHGAVGMVTDGERPRHTHRPDAMRRMLEDERPDLVVGDHGYAGAAIEDEIETLAIADVNDPALIVAKAQGRTRHLVVLDDHVPPEAYWPCFQAVAARLRTERTQAP